MSSRSDSDTGTITTIFMLRSRSLFARSSEMIWFRCNQLHPCSRWRRALTERLLSYLTHEGLHDPAADIELHDRLAASGHFSPFEHCAQAIKAREYSYSNFDQPTFAPITDGLSHWLQYRKMMENENNTSADLPAIFATKPDWIQI